MDIKNISSSTYRNAMIIIGVTTIIFTSIVAFTYVNLIRNEHLHQTTFHNRFQSRLLFKAITGLANANNQLAQAMVNKDVEPIIEAEAMVQSSFSDYRIFISEKYIHGEELKLDRESEYNQLLEVLNTLIERNQTDKKNILESQEKINTVIGNIYSQEANIWQSEALRYNEISIAQKKNRLFFYSMIAFFILSEIGLIYFMLLRLRLLEKIKHQHEKLIISTRLSTLGEMSAELAHEINNPLMVINGRAKVVRDHLKNFQLDIELINKNIEIIQRNGERIEKIVKAYKLLSRSGTNDHFETVYLEKIFTDLKELTERRISDSQIDFIISPLDPELKIEVKLVQILQVFTNLVSNSIHAITKLDHRWIKIDVIEDNDEYHFHFQDSGSGIKKEYVPYLFDAFFTTKSSREGTGLGLSISAKLVKDHHGRIFYNEKNAHTEFIVILPKRQVQKSPA